MGYELIGFGALGNLLYAAAGYFKAKSEDSKTSFEWKKFIRTVLVGAVPPIAVLVVNYFGIVLPAGFEIVNFLGPALDKALKAFGI